MTAGTVPQWLDLDRLARTRPMTGWIRWAACRGRPPAEMYTHARKPPEQIRKMCEGCPTRYACLAETIEAEKGHAVVGHPAATTPPQRIAIRRALEAREAA